MLGERLVKLRKDAELTQDALAAILNVNKHSISSYERDKSEPPDVIKIAIARHFGVSVDYLLGLTDNPASYAAQESPVHVPRRLPPKAIAELTCFIDYLLYKYSSKSTPPPLTRGVR